MKARYATPAKGANLTAQVEIEAVNVVIVKGCILLERDLERKAFIVNI